MMGCTDNSYSALHKLTSEAAEACPDRYRYRYAIGSGTGNHRQIARYRFDLIDKIRKK